MVLSPYFTSTDGKTLCFYGRGDCVLREDTVFRESVLPSQSLPKKETVSSGRTLVGVFPEDTVYWERPQGVLFRPSKVIPS